MYVCKHLRSLSRQLSAFSTKFFCLRKLNSIDLREVVKDDSEKCAKAGRIVRFKLLSPHLITENERSTKLLRIASVCAQNRTRKSPNSCQEVEPLIP